MHWGIFVLSVAAFFSLSACYAGEEAALDCERMNSEDVVSFDSMATQMIENCGSCHSAEYPVMGYAFDSSASIYANSQKSAQKIYAQMVLGLMPPGGGIPESMPEAYKHWICEGMFNE
jgi:uncharacterized membrane protein